MSDEWCVKIEEMRTNADSIKQRQTTTRFRDILRVLLDLVQHCIENTFPVLGLPNNGSLSDFRANILVFTLDINVT
jgi:hypothetical protein